MNNVSRTIIEPQSFESVYPTMNSTAVAKSYGGPGVGVVEVQVTLLPPGPSGRGKIITIGVSREELYQAAEGILRLPHFTEPFHYTIQCRLVGDDKHRRYYGLALCVAVAAVFLNKSVPKDHLYLGEVDLTRNVRDLSPKRITDLLAALDQGEVGLPVTVLTGPLAASSLEGGDGLTAVPCATVGDALGATWPNAPKPKSAKKRRSRDASE